MTEAVPAQAAERGDRDFVLVLLCFFLSGASALIYQTAWTRQFAFVFGTSELAVATVLAAYMGGLATGAVLGGRLVPRVRRPIRVYALLELAIAVSALAIPAAMRGATWLYVALFGGSVATPPVGGLATAAFYAACAFVILTVPTACMGATLPLLAQHAVRSDTQLGRRVGLLYAVNTIGAVIGTLCAGFVLLPSVGLAPTVWVAVAVNGMVFFFATLLVRTAPPLVAAEHAVRPSPLARGRERLILPLVMISGSVSFGYEVLWTRLLSQLLGASVYAFATMLATFLVGIALGALLGARGATDARRAAAGFGLAQLAIAVLSVAAFAGIDELPALARRVASAGADRLWLDAAADAIILLPSTLAIGATFPLAVRVFARGEWEAGPASASVYAWNTAGSVVGALAAGFVAIPALGFAGSVATAASLNLALAAASGWLVSPPRLGLPVTAAALGVGLVALPPATPWNLLRTLPLSLAQATGDLTYFSVGRSSTVLMLERRGGWYLSNNGLPEAAIEPPGGSIFRDNTTSWLGALPAIARPHAESMLVVGFGGGAALEAVPPSVRHIDVVELEPEVVAANQAIGPLRARDPLADPRVSVILNDARNALALTGRRYDAIVSQPSHPWTTGSSHLYTREFFTLAKSRLSEDGVLLQWIGPAYVDGDLLRILAATLGDVFASVRIYQSSVGDGILLLASDRPLDVEAAAGQAIAEQGEFLATLGIDDVSDVAAALALDESAVRRFSAGAPLNTDGRNYLEVRSPKIALQRHAPLWLERTLLDAGLEPELPRGVDRAPLARSLLARQFVHRAERLAKTTPDPIERRLLEGLVWEAQRENGRALVAFRAVLAQRPADGEARAGLIRVMGPGAPLPPGAGPAESRLSAALSAAGRGDFAAVASADAALAEIAPASPLFREATRLRVRWRLAEGNAERAREAIALFDRVGPLGRTTVELLDRAGAGVLAGSPGVVRATLEEWLGRPVQGPRRAQEAQQALALLASLQPPDGQNAWSEDLAERLRAIAAGPRH